MLRRPRGTSSGVVLKATMQAFDWRLVRAGNRADDAGTPREQGRGRKRAKTVLVLAGRDLTLRRMCDIRAAGSPSCRRRAQGVTVEGSAKQVALSGFLSPVTAKRCTSLDVGFPVTEKRRASMFRPFVAKDARRARVLRRLAVTPKRRARLLHRFSATAKRHTILLHRSAAASARSLRHLHRRAATAFLPRNR